MGMTGGPPMSILYSMRFVGELLSRLQRLPKPTIALVDGACMGVSVGIALACDLIVASDRAKFASVFIKRGLALDGGTSWSLPHQIGLRRAKQMAFFGDTVPAQTALQWGLVNEVVPAADLERVGGEWASRLANSATTAISLIKKEMDSAFHQSFEQAVEAERSWAGRNGTDLGLLLVDLDALKEINDSRGHPAGDRVLMEVARRITRSMRRQDICGRWGGDEFVVLVSECDEFALSRFAERLLAAVRRTPIEFDDGGVITVTVSIGACMVDIARSVEISAAKADAALYTAKASGRNRLVMYDPARHAPQRQAEAPAP
jgi:diguanylate cyclase (GGDEF)-like protein